jgi:hypothetical protein
MCATDLDLDLEPEIAEDEQATGPQPASGQAPGVAWGRAEHHPAARADRVARAARAARAAR